MERVLVSRQPIYRPDQSELGYELLFRNSNNNFASFSDGDQATAEVIVNTFMEIGLDELVGRHLAFINFDRNLILGGYCKCLPRERVVLEILETIQPDTALGQPLPQIVAFLPLSSDIVDALIGQRGKLGTILQCVMEYERRNWDRAQAAISLDKEVIGEAYRKSVGWTLSTLNGFSSNREVHVAS